MDGPAPHLEQGASRNCWHFCGYNQARCLQGDAAALEPTRSGNSVAPNPMVMDKPSPRHYYLTIMASDRIQRRINRLLDQAEEAMNQLKWGAVREYAQAALGLDAGNTAAHMHSWIFPPQDGSRGVSSAVVPGVAGVTGVADYLG